MAGVTAQRTAIMVIVNAPALFILISLLLLLRIEHLLVLDQAIDRSHKVLSRGAERDDTPEHRSPSTFVQTYPAQKT